MSATGQSVRQDVGAQGAADAAPAGRGRLDVLSVAGLALGLVAILGGSILKGSGLAALWNRWAHLTGFGSDEGTFLTIATGGQINLSGVMLAGSILNINGGAVLNPVQVLFNSFLIGIFPAIAISGVGLDFTERLELPDTVPGARRLWSSFTPSSRPGGSFSSRGVCRSCVCSQRR